MECLLCKTLNFKSLFKLNMYPYMECQRCGLIFSPFRNNLDFKKIYSKDYYIYDKKRNSGYIDYIKNSSLFELTFIKVLRRIERYKKSGKLLEIGSALGFFLKIAQKKRWDITGIEISDFAIKFAQENLGINLFHGKLKEAVFPDNSFDVVVMNDLIEHLASPLEELREVYRILKPDGILYINTPDASSLSAKLFGKYWWHYKIKEHLFLFSYSTIHLLLKKAHFSILEIKPSSKVVNIAYIIEKLKMYNGILSNLFSPILKWKFIADLKFPLKSAEMSIIAKPKNKSIA